MKKTLLVTLDFYPSIGGVSYYWMKLSEQMSASDIVVVAPPLPEGTKELSVSYRIIRKQFLSSWLKPAWGVLIKNVWRVVHQERPGMIIVGQILPVGTAVWLLSFFMKIPYIVSCHGMDVMQPKSVRKRWLMKQIVGRAVGVIANSQFTGRAVQSLGVSEKKISYVYPCPVNIGGAFENNIVHKQDNHTLLTVGRIVQRKGHEYVIKSLPEVLKKYPDMAYIIIGEGAYKKVLEKMVSEMGLGKHVRFLGALDDEQTKEWYHSADVFIMTPVDNNGDVEGFGIVYLEAAAWGLPAIATSTGGVGEAVLDGVTGIVVPQRDVDAIQTAIIELFDNPSRARQYGKMGKERVEKDFQWQVQAKILEQTINTHML